MNVPDIGPPVPARSHRIEPVLSVEEADGLPALELSDRFDPFLPHFIRETLRGGGEASIVREGPRAVALWLSDPMERAASLFTRSGEVVEDLLASRPPTPFYCELDLPRRRERFDLYARDLDPTLGAHRFRHRIRVAQPDELSRVRDLTREAWGPVNDRWFSGFAARPEACFVAEVGSELVGVAWATALGIHGRLHSLSVRPGYRRLGIGTDLLFARLLWLERQGVRDALSEISEHNAASRAVAERAGMRPVGRIYLYSKG